MTHLSTLSGPEDFELSAIEFFYATVRKTQQGKFLDIVLNLLTLPSTATTIQDQLDPVSPKEFESIIHLLHITLFARSCHARQPLLPDLTPVSGALKTLLENASLESTLDLLPSVLCDVLTSHPVDMDRGLIISHKQDYETLSRDWEHHKAIYSRAEDLTSKIQLRAKLNELHQKLENIILYLVHTPNYRQNRVRPESEQRQLSRAIKDHEQAIILHWDKLMTVVQSICLQHLLETLIQENPHLENYKRYLKLPHTKSNLSTLKEIPEIKCTPIFSQITELPNSLKYRLETWRGDMDGNPFVTAKTIALSIAYGRKRSFERFSADQAVIRYNRNCENFKQIEKELNKKLETLKSTGTKAWKNYISEREAAKWTPTQIYSGLAYYRMVELTEAAENFSRNPVNLRDLKTGFETSTDFLEFTEALEKIEDLIGLEGGTWSQQRQLVKLRQLSLGQPHLRKGEDSHISLIGHCLSEPELKNDWAALQHLSESDQIKVLNKTLSSRLTIETPLESIPEESSKLLDTYLKMMEIDPCCTLIQSDSGDTLKSIEASIIVMKIISKLLGHHGKVVILCENKNSMTSAIKVMTQKNNTTFFDRVIMMCAGSDNQKKLGPFYSAYLNHNFLKTAHKQKIESFFGVGDSPLRSSLHTPICNMKTFQPGSRKHHFFGERIHRYLSNRLATHISVTTAQLQAQNKHKQHDDTIFRLFGESMFDAYKKALEKNKDLQVAIKDISEIVTTYFSRPTKKTAKDSSILDQIRAIDSGRAQLILNTFDPQLAGLNDGIKTFQQALKDNGISLDNCHHFFTNSAEGTAMLNTLAHFANMLDDSFATPSSLRSVTQADIKIAYEKLSGQKLKITSDPTLRVVREIWAYVNKRPDLNDHTANTLLLFGANWMI